MFVAGVAIHLVQGGFLFLPERVAMNLSRLNPLSGLQRIFAMNNLVRLLFGLFKIGVIAAVAGLSLYNDSASILNLSGHEVGEIAAYLASTLLWTTLRIGVALVVLAVLDYGFQFWSHERDLRMTPQEIREEMRHLEGDPQIAARRRACSGSSCSTAFRPPCPRPT